MKKFELAKRALNDLQQIWDFVSEDSFDAADRLLEARTEPRSGAGDAASSSQHSRSSR